VFRGGSACQWPGPVVDRSEARTRPRLDVPDASRGPEGVARARRTVILTGRAIRSTIRRSNRWGTGAPSIGWPASFPSFSTACHT
jgi:hypothetical protein